MRTLATIVSPGPVIRATPRAKRPLRRRGRRRRRRGPLPRGRAPLRTSARIRPRSRGSAARTAGAPPWPNCTWCDGVGWPFNARSLPPPSRGARRVPRMRAIRLAGHGGVDTLTLAECDGRGASSHHGRSRIHRLLDRGDTARERRAGADPRRLFQRPERKPRRPARAIEPARRHRGHDRRPGHGRARDEGRAGRLPPGGDPQRRAPVEDPQADRPTRRAGHRTVVLDEARAVAQLCRLRRELRGVRRHADAAQDRDDGPATALSVRGQQARRRAPDARLRPASTAPGR